MGPFDPRAILKLFTDKVSGWQGQAEKAPMDDDRLNRGVELAEQAYVLTGEPRVRKLKEAELAFHETLSHMSCDSEPLDYASQHYNFAIFLSDLGRESEGTNRETRFSAAEQRRTLSCYG